MPINKIFALLASLFFLLCAGGSLGLAQQSPEEEFRLKRKINSDKIDDFYSRYIQLERLDAERRKGENEMRQSRKTKILEYEQSRKEFVQTRKAKPIMDPSAWEKEIAEKQKAYKLNQQDYVKKRDELNRLLNTMGRIPGEDEFDINLEPDPSTQ